MKRIHLVRLIVIFMFFISCTSEVENISTDEKGKFKTFATTPPMGWNSFDAYDSRINEKDFKATVDIMEKRLSDYGWEYAVIDYIWWHPSPGSWDTQKRFGHPNIRYEADGSPLYPEYTTIDEYGRLLPAIERFPSSSDGKGFKPLADYVHNKGLKFGIHLMRGIHRVAWFNDLPIKGTEHTARDIAEPFDTCSWCNHMFGVDPRKPGAQEYYNSLFELYAEWEVDYVKVDDILRPKYHAGEIELIRNAIDNCGRDMVLSLSPGEAPLGQARHLEGHANMWRISADLWDEWEDIEHNFKLLNSWSPFIGNGTWPDADMLPLGRISLDNRPHGPERMTMLTWDEQITMMNLWSIAKSPLMLGADLISSPDSTFLLLTNEEVLYVNQNSTENRQVLHRDRYNDWEDQRDYFVVWHGADPANEDRFIALFNLSESTNTICFPLEYENMRGTWKVRDLWKKEDLGNIEGKVCAELRPHASVLYRLGKVDE